MVERLNNLVGFHEHVERYRNRLDVLLKWHQLSLPGDRGNRAIEALAKRIMFTNRYIAQKIRKQATKKTLLRQLDKAINQTSALINRTGDLAKHYLKLQAAISDVHLAIELAVHNPPILVDQIIAELNSPPVSEETLMGLSQTLGEIRNLPRDKPGRPKDFHSPIFFGITRVWTLAGRSPTYSNNCEILSGPFIDFLRDVYILCEVPTPNDAAIHSRLQTMLKNYDFST